MSPGVSQNEVEEYRRMQGGEPEEIGFSEDELALEFTRRYGDDLLYVDEWNRWPRWDGSKWKADRTREVFDLARKLCRRAAEFAPNERDAKRLRSAQTIAAVVKLASSDRGHARVTEDFDSDAWLLNTPGGTVDLRTGATREHRRRDHLTKITTVTPGGDCPLWRAALKRWTANDDEFAGFVGRLIGYALTGSTREHRFAFFYGGGSNGKGTFLNLLTWMLGDYAAVAPIETFTESKGDRHPTELAMLRGARLVVAQETTEGRRWDETRIKTLTGGDPISARFMRRDFFTFTPQFKLLVSGNHKPGIRTVDEAMKRRLMLIPFDVTIPDQEKDPELAEKLRAEAPGILTWAINGCLEWQNIGLGLPARVLEATMGYFSEQDSIGRWLDECCAIGAQFRAEKRRLYESWVEWGETNREYVLSKRQLLSELRGRLELDEATVGKGNVEAFIGVGLVDGGDR